MSEKEARAILQDYWEEDEDTGEEYSLTVKECIYSDGVQFVFRCELDGQETEYAVMKATKTVLAVPT